MVTSLGRLCKGQAVEDGIRLRRENTSRLRKEKDGHVDILHLCLKGDGVYEENSRQNGRGNKV